MNDRTTSAPATSTGHTRLAGEGISDTDMVKEVASQTSPNLVVEPIFRTEADGTDTDQPIRQHIGQRPARLNRTRG